MKIKMGWNKLTLQNIIDCMDEKYYLYYVDYRESLDDWQEEVQRCRTRFRGTVIIS